MYKITDIMTVPAMIRINGQKAIEVVGKMAYAQVMDGMMVYWYDEKRKEWKLVAYKRSEGINY